MYFLREQIFKKVFEIYYLREEFFEMYFLREEFYRNIFWIAFYEGAILKIFWEMLKLAADWNE